MINSDLSLIVHLDRIAANLQILQAQLSDVTSIIPVVKANAYGLGIEPVAKMLWQEGYHAFFVATVEEGVELRSIIKDATIYVFHGASPSTLEACLTYRLTPILNHPGQTALWQEAAESSPLPAGLHIDTAMHRLGYDAKEWSALITDQEQLLAGLNIELIMSHLACADTPLHPLNKRQLTKFTAAHSAIKAPKCSLANSAGIYLGSAYHFDVVRPGCALFGIDPVAEGETDLKQVVSIYAKIIQLHTLETNHSVGYGATFNGKAGTKVATVAMGYADGYPYGLANNAKAYIGGCYVPVIGRISMDLITLDVTAVNVPLEIGMEVELMGEHVSVNYLAKQARTIGYEILTGLGNRFNRMYQEND